MSEPSIESARGALGEKIEYRAHPIGLRGASVSLEEVARRIREGRLDPRVRAWAGEVLIKAGKPKAIVDQAQALLDAVRDKTMYVADPVGAEFVVAAKNTLCLDEKGLCVPVADCFPKGTLLLRDDFTLVPIESIQVGERIWGFDKWTTVEAVRFSGELPIYAIFMNNGSVLQLTKDHKVYTAKCKKHIGYRCSCETNNFTFERKRVSDVEPKEVLLMPHSLPFGTEDLDPGQAYIEGLYISDGWCSHKNQFSISGQDGCPKEFQKREVALICDRLGLDTIWYRKSIVVKSKSWSPRIQQMGHYAPEKHALSINLNERTATETLRGIMADSGANTSGPGRTFTTTSKILAVQTRILHKMFGTSCGGAYIENHGGLGLNPIWRLFVRVQKRSDGKRQKVLRVKRVEKNIGSAPCYDIQTSDHYVYLPEHDVTVSNCDDLTVALGSALMSVGIPVKVIGQAFDGGNVPVHVMLGIKGQFGLKRIEPSDSHYRVGQSHPAATREWVIDPMDQKPVNLVGMHGSNPAGGEFVGIGQAPAIVDAVTNQLQTAVYSLQKSNNDLAAAMTQLQNTRTLLRGPGNIYDPEPFSITSLADFPSGGIWTKSMENVSLNIWGTADKLIRAGQEALAGTRKLFIDEQTHDAYIEAIPSDVWRLSTIAHKAKETVLGVYDSAANLIGGMVSTDGRSLTKEQAQAEVQSGVVHGLGAAFPIAVVAVTAAVAIASVSAIFIVNRWATANTAAVREATNQSVMSCIASGKCSVEQGKELIQATSNARVAESKADAANNAIDPFHLADAGALVKWLAIGGVVVVGLVTLAPVLSEVGKSVAESHRTKRLARA